MCKDIFFGQKNRFIFFKFGAFFSSFFDWQQLTSSQFFVCFLFSILVVVEDQEDVGRHHGLSECSFTSSWPRFKTLPRIAESQHGKRVKKESASERALPIKDLLPFSAPRWLAQCSSAASDMYFHSYSCPGAFWRLDRFETKEEKEKRLVPADHLTWATTDRLSSVPVSDAHSRSTATHGGGPATQGGRHETHPGLAGRGGHQGEVIAGSVGHFQNISTCASATPWTT